MSEIFHRVNRLFQNTNKAMECNVEILASNFAGIEKKEDITFHCLMLNLLPLEHIKITKTMTISIIIIETQEVSIILLYYIFSIIAATNFEVVTSCAPSMLLAKS